jgi:hypothetical protein
MYNANRPKLSELPSPARLLRSTLIAAASAAAILVAVVLPSEYGLDPTGAGRLLGLTKMGEIKTELSAEAAADRAPAEAAAAMPAAPAPDLSGLYQRIDALELAVRELASTLKATQTTSTSMATDDQIAAAAQSAASSDGASSSAPSGTDTAAETPAVNVSTASVGAEGTVTPADISTEPAAEQPKQDKAKFTLSPGQGIEIKLAMKKGAKANFAWSTEGGPVNFDTHGDGAGDLKISYEKGRGVQSDEGTLIAEFDGNHGWFWRNRGQDAVTLTLSTAGYYSAIKGIPN